ncbi:MAG: tripartite tricarboxylate transporter substrate binding protein [Hyphomicrobiaceae bacterium]|nr:tripartite tricarboxylate transporter substrate binding protein [Hyphomicrobiaceae bacterium]
MKSFRQSVRPGLARLGLAAGILALAVLLPAAPALAADWPTKPVRVIYNYPPGTGGDVVTRTVAEALHKSLGQPFVVENRSGAAGTVGVEAASRMTGDGYTILASPNAPMVLLPQLRKVAYDPKDFRPIAAMGEYVYGWAVLPSLGVKTVAELVALAKSKPGHLSYSSPGVGSATNLRGEALNILAGINTTHIPYRGGPDALNDFLAGRVDIMLDNAHYAHVKTGKAVMLAMTSSRRHPDFPDVPTMAEAGYKIDLPTWLAFYAIKGTPEDIGLKFGKAVAEIMARPEIKRRLLDIGFFAMDEKPEELNEMNKREFASYEAWVKRANFKID